MEKRPHPFDEFLKETLKGHQLVPPEEAKKDFLREAGTIIQPRKGFFRWYYIPVLVVSLSGFVAVFYFRNNTEPATTGKTLIENVSTVPALVTDTNSGLVRAPEISPVNTPTSDLTQTSSYKATAKSQSDSNLRSASTSASANTVITSAGKPEEKQYPAPISKGMPDDKADAVISATGNSDQHDTLFSATTSNKLALDSLDEAVVSIEDQVAINQTAGPDTSLSSSPPSTNGTGKPERVAQENYFTAGVYYLPQWLFNTFDGNKFFYNLGAEVNYYYGAFSIRTGVGISVSKDVKKIAVEYNDYLGSYNKLDSVSFSFSEQAHDFIPNYYMSIEEVWDTVPLLDYPELKMRYTFLQIPLVFGYDFLQQGRFSLGIRLGTTLSLLLDSKQLSENYNPGQNKVINVYGITPDYVSVNWQMTGGLNASLRFADNLFFEIEPMAKYFYKSIYESPGSTKVPLSVGFRAAILFKF